MRKSTLILWTVIVVILAIVGLLFASRATGGAALVIVAALVAVAATVVISVRVLFSQLPSPLDSYRRRMDAVASGGSRKRTSPNAAEPGGIIEVDESVSDEEFERMVQRWRQQH